MGVVCPNLGSHRRWGVCPNLGCHRTAGVCLSLGCRRSLEVCLNLGCHKGGESVQTLISQKEKAATSIPPSDIYLSNTLP